MTPRQLRPEELDALARELDALRRVARAAVGPEDHVYIRRVLRAIRVLEVAGRGLLHLGIGPLSFAAGTGALALSRVLENMEVGHNVMHGQYDWTEDPSLDSHSYEWDNVCDSDHWRHSHNYEHHTYTNVLGLDRDIGYMFLRVNAAQRWQPLHLVQPFGAALLALLFQFGVGLHDLRIGETLAGRQPPAELGKRARPFLRKAGWQLAKDYVAFPALALWNAPRVLAGNMLANVMRNMWTFGIIFCGHFPDGVRVFTVEETQRERRGDWYLRQLAGSANIEGSRAFHVMSGHLSHQIEHHLFPDLPASRYPEIAARVRAICERYGQGYNTGGFGHQLRSVARQLISNALP
jgi:linoleoyl-CoA desaturase